MACSPPRRHGLLALLGMFITALLGGANSALAQPALPAPPVPVPVRPVADALALPQAPGPGVPAPDDADPSTTPAPNAATPGAAKTAEKSDAANSFWLTNPPSPVLPRPGFFFNPPTGPGYYSLVDLLTGNYRDKAPPMGYPRFAVAFWPFFEYTWRYVDQPGYQPDFWDRLHRIHLGDDWLLSVGGEFRDRYASEMNSRLTGKDNTYNLDHVRLHTDLWYRNTFRVYVEFLTAQSSAQNLPPQLIDRDQADLLNAFIDLKVFEDDAGVPWYVRGGRQQLAFGSQRLLSPLDWANVPRTFDGVRAFRHSDNLDVDAFWVRPVIPQASGWSSSDQQQNLAGTWFSYRPNKQRTLDLYYLYYSDDNVFNPKTKTPLTTGSLAQAPYTVNTLGYRYNGHIPVWENVLFDSENMLQVGRSGFYNSDIVAGSSSTGLGYHFANAPMNPTLWGYFDYATGSSKLAQGQQVSTFNQLFPFGHYYFGWLDFVGRSNIQDLNFILSFYPQNWILCWIQYHNFWLANPRDALYSPGDSIVRYDPTGKAGNYVGNEWDFIVNFHVAKQQDILVVWSYLNAGEFLRATGSGSSAQGFWLMYTMRW